MKKTQIAWDIHHTSYFLSMGNYLGYELIAGNEWLWLAVIAICNGYLFRMAWRSIKGKEDSALFLD
jgi:protein-S-isoprenylcysteine O-methyltransferase Ste14